MIACLLTCVLRRLIQLFPFGGGVAIPFEPGVQVYHCLIGVSVGV